MKKIIKIDGQQPSYRAESGLTIQQEEFCRLFSGQDGDRELYGNGMKSYLEAYNMPPSKWPSAAASATRLLKDVKICNRINELLEEGGFNDQNVDKQHAFLINQYSDFKTKLGAVKEYNSLKKRTEQPLGNNYFTLIQQIINESKGNIVEGRLREAESKTLRQGVEDEQSLLHSEQGGQEDSTQIEQATDLLASQPSLQELRSQS